MLIWNRLISMPFLRIRALRCYIYLLLWLVIFSAGLYWFLSSSESESAREILLGHRITEEGQNLGGRADFGLVGPGLAKTPVHFVNLKSSQGIAEDAILETASALNATVMRLCNAPELIQARDENLQHPAYKLDAIVIIFRHGDRGPLSHIGKRNVSHINCKGDLHKDFHTMHRYMTETITKITGYSQFIGPFHSFPKVPNGHSCHLGQLTQVGSSQLLHLGQMIRSTYQSTLPLLGLYGGNGRVVAYSTRYRRTLQSLMAFLYGLLGSKILIPTVTIRESQSINFCFNDCSCRASDRLQKTATKLYSNLPGDKTVKNNLFDHINRILDLDKNKKTGLSLLDLLLVYPCHRAPLPCRVINPVGPGGQSTECITKETLASLIKTIKTDSQGLQSILQQRQHSLLSSYGLLKEILMLSLRMTSSNGAVLHKANGASQAQKSRLAIFSGHDTTLQSLVGALGVFSGHPDIHLPPFASRLIFEFYKKSNVSPESPRKHFFRVIYNGHVVTHLISFCKYLYLRQKNEDFISSKEYMCPLENLVRFLHDNYFESFGNSTTNFRDACR